MQIDSWSKIIFMHIPRTGGSWFGYSWYANKDHTGTYSFISNKYLKNNINNKHIACGKHGKISGILEKLEKIGADVSNYKIITLVREPLDRVISSWRWFRYVKDTAKKHGRKNIDGMLDEMEKGRVRANYMPQTDWLCEPGAKFHHVFRFEDLLKNADTVNKIFPKFTPPNKLRRSHEKIKVTQKQIDRIKDLYSDDFKYLKPWYPHLNIKK